MMNFKVKYEGIYYFGGRSAEGLLNNLFIL